MSEQDGAITRLQAAPSVASGSAGVFILRDVALGQECFQDCDVGLDFRDLNVQLGHYLPDLVLTQVYDLPSPTSSPPSSADSSATLPATSCRLTIDSAARR